MSDAGDPAGRPVARLATGPERVVVRAQDHSGPSEPEQPPGMHREALK